APFLSRWSADGRVVPINPVLPAVTCSVQATYLTGVVPGVHGIVGNGWYFRDECEVKFWRQSNHLVQAETLWETARARDSSFTCANLFWWYNMYSSVDYSATPRPMYPADGRKIPDVYTQPADLRYELQEELGQFPLFEFWGPRTTINSSRWIARAAMKVEEKYAPTLSLVYLPHLDYELQRVGPRGPGIDEEVRQVDALCEELIGFFEGRGVAVIVLSEYGITQVSRGVSLNRLLREHGFITIREELGRELLDPGASRAFAVADHQLAHIYVKDRADVGEVQSLIEAHDGVDIVLSGRERDAAGLRHERAGDLIAVSKPDAWFTYYYWMDDDRAPDFARTVDIHRKPGYDPVELFVDPSLKAPMLKMAFRLAQKKLGFRYLMDVIPLDASLVKGSHGRLPSSPGEGPLVISRGGLKAERIHATGIADLILRQVFPG
ncbi:MAG: nucleotide pyrophosphatase/phosphodiesterase family protein, partial [Rhodothermales bacterium]